MPVIKIYKVFWFAFLTLVPLLASAQPQTDEQLAVQYFQNTEYEKAVVLFEKLYNDTPSPLYYSYFMECMVEMGDFKKAERFVSKQIKRDPGSMKYLVDLGYLYQKQGEIEKAQAQYQQAIKSLPADQVLITDLANAFLQRNLSEFAVQTYEKGRKLLKSYYNFGFELSEIYIRNGDYLSAFGEYLDLIVFNSAYTDKVLGNLQDILAEDPAGSRADQLRIELLQRIKKDPDKTVFSEILLWLYIQIKEFPLAVLQAKSLDKRLGEDGSRLYNLGLMAANNKDYNAAIECFDYIIEKKGEFNPYYFESRMEKINVRFSKITDTYTYTVDDLRALEADYNQMLNDQGRSSRTVSLMLNLARLEAFYLNNSDLAISLLNEAVLMPGINLETAAHCKLQLADILLMTGEVWDATLLYSQVEKAFKNEPLGHEAKFRNAKLYFYIGEFDYAKSALDVLKAATSKLIANDALHLSLLISDNIGEDSTYAELKLYAKGDLLLFQNRYDEAIKTLDSINMLSLYHPLFDEVVFKKAQIMVKKGHLVEADSLLNELVRFYPNDILADDALYMLAQLSEEYCQCKERTMQLYQDLITNFPGSIYVVEARKKFRELRGDKIN